MTTNIKAGGIYSVESGEGGFGVVKVLVIEDDVAHIRIYKNKYPTRPAQIELSTLTLGTVFDKDGFGIGHTPIEVDSFRAWKPEFLAESPLTEEELEGYELWREDQGGTFH